TTTQGHQKKQITKFASDTIKSYLNGSFFISKNINTPLSSASKNILLFGAGKSATVLIRYLLEKAQQYNWTLTVAEADVQLALAKTQSHPRSAVLKLDVTQNDARMGAIQNADVVISL